MTRCSAITRPTLVGIGEHVELKMSDENKGVPGDDAALLFSKDPDRWSGCLRHVEYARLRCLGSGALLRELPRFAREGVRAEVVDQLIERDLSARETHVLAQVLFALLEGDAV